jgi:hypothetical protein
MLVPTPSRKFARWVFTERTFGAGAATAAKAGGGRPGPPAAARAQAGVSRSSPSR